MQLRPYTSTASTLWETSYILDTDQVGNQHTYWLSRTLPAYVMYVERQKRTKLKY